MDKLKITSTIWIILLATILLASLMGLLFPAGNWLRSGLVYLVALGIGLLCIYGTWRAVKAPTQVTAAARVAFSVRLMVGIVLALLLPVVGYANNTEHRAGYVYTDAYNRDNQAWELAKSSTPLIQAFSGQYTSDQYGGMLALSAFVYRALSPDAHRPLLIIVLSAVASAIGVLCLGKAASGWLGEKIALLAAWLFALYPESILLGSSQMREAFVIPATAASFYGLTQLQAKKPSGWVWLALSALLLFTIQPLAGFISLVVLFGVWLLDPLTVQASGQRRTLITIFMLAGILFIAMLVVSSILVNLPSVQGSKFLSAFLVWFQNNFTYQSYLTERSSGMFQSLIDSLGQTWRWLIVLVYGIAQPVLPATVGDPDAAWIMRIMGFLRAAGWYALALFLVYGTLGAFRNRTEPRRLQIIWISLVTWAWIMLAALNAGADQWDNPRYRVILLLWQVILAAWAWIWAKERKDAWLWRWLAIEAVFVGFFTEWYLGRYYPGFFHLDIKVLTLIVLLISGGIIAGGIIWDKKHTS